MIVMSNNSQYIFMHTIYVLLTMEPTISQCVYLIVKRHKKSMTLSNIIICAMRNLQWYHIFRINRRDFSTLCIINIIFYPFQFSLCLTFSMNFRSRFCFFIPIYWRRGKSCAEKFVVEAFYFLSKLYVVCMTDHVKALLAEKKEITNWQSHNHLSFN